jgi:hypothetical protein
MLLIPPLGLFAGLAGPLGPGGAIVRVGRRLPRDLPPQFPSASPDRIEHGATSPEETASRRPHCSISALAPEKASASGDLWHSQTTVANYGRRTIGPALRAGRAFARIPRNQVAATPPIPHATAVPTNPACWRWSCADAHCPPTGRLGHRNDPQPCGPTPPACQPTRVMPAHQLRVLRSSRQQACAPTTAPNHPIRVRIAHPGWAHAGRQPVGWAKGARS